MTFAGMLLDVLASKGKKTIQNNTLECTKFMIANKRINEKTA